MKTLFKIYTPPMLWRLMKIWGIILVVFALHKVLKLNEVYSLIFFSVSLVLSIFAVIYDRPLDNFLYWSTITPINKKQILIFNWVLSFFRSFLLFLSSCLILFFYHQDINQNYMAKYYSSINIFFYFSLLVIVAFFNAIIPTWLMNKNQRHHFKDYFPYLLISIGIIFVIYHLSIHGLGFWYLSLFLFVCACLIILQNTHALKINFKIIYPFSLVILGGIFVFSSATFFYHHQGAHHQHWPPLKRFYSINFLGKNLFQDNKVLLSNLMETSLSFEEIQGIYHLKDDAQHDSQNEKSIFLRFDYKKAIKNKVSFTDLIFVMNFISPQEFDLETAAAFVKKLESLSKSSRMPNFFGDDFLEGKKLVHIFESYPHLGPTLWDHLNMNSSESKKNLAKALLLFAPHEIVFKNQDSILHLYSLTSGPARDHIISYLYQIEKWCIQNGKKTLGRKIASEQFRTCL